MSRLMTPLNRQNRFDLKLLYRVRNDHYLLINIILAGVVLLIFAYSGFFSPVKENYPVICIHEKLTGEPCISCGLSHSFSLILRGRIEEAYEWNVYGLRIFLFFALQLIMRFVFSVLHIKNPGLTKHFIIYDISGSILIFLISFTPYISGIVRSVAEIL